MTIPFFGSPGALFNALGKLGVLVSDVNNFQATLKPHLIDPTNGAIAQYAAEPDLAAQIGNNWIGLLGGLEGSSGLSQALTAATINRLVYLDNPQLGQTLTTANLLTSINEVIRQMRGNGITVLQIQPTANPPSTFTGSGNGVPVVSLRRPFDGRLLENAFSETLLFTCTSDSFTGGASVGNETLTVTGEGAESDVFAFDWPLGSNGSTQIQAINSQANNSQGNLLTNSSFNTFVTTPNVPDNWTVVTGTPGTQLLQESAIIYNGTAALKMVGDGSTQTTIKQQFGVSSGTSATLNTQAQYSFNLFLRTGGVAPSQGILTISLIDQNANVIKDAGGNSNLFTIDLTKLNTNYTAFTGAFRTPEALPSQIYIQISQTTPMNNGAVAYLDSGSMGAMTQLYVHGPFVSCHSGSIPFVASPIADYATCLITNPRGAGGTLNTFQTLLYRLLPIGQSNEILWPSSSSPTVSDGLIS